MEFEIIDVRKERQRILVEIEMAKTRQRKQYGYPLGEGWEGDMNGEPKFLWDIKNKLRAEEELDKRKIDISKIKNSLKGKKIKLD